jgi:hypothetical protein
MKIAFVGDLFLGGEFIPYASGKGIDLLSPFEEIISLTRDADIFVVNLEGPICGQENNRRKDVVSILSNNLDVLKFINEHGNCVINLANNHMMDYGEQGLNETVSALKKHDLNFIGAGRNYREANQELSCTVNNRKVAFISYTSDAPHIRAIIATDSTAGCAAYTDLNVVLKKIQELKQTANTVCVLLHWGYEFHQYPTPDQVKIAHSMADAGADLIIGHHPHVIQGIELYNRSLIAYSLGNLFFPDFRSVNNRIQYVKPISKEFMILISELSTDGHIRYESVGGILDESYRLRVHEGKKKVAFLENQKALSEPLKRTDYDSFWARYKIKREKELQKESISEAVYKLRKTPIKQLFKEVKFDDLKRNVKRILKALSK